jgi:hypothetical protein
MPAGFVPDNGIQMEELPQRYLVAQVGAVSVHQAGDICDVRDHSVSPVSRLHSLRQLSRYLPAARIQELSRAAG